ncbi:MAG: superoxide dismutase [Planctomycetota bacterium]
MIHELPPLPFAMDALAAKGISKETLEYHYGKHHKAYVDKLNELIKGKADLEKKTLEELVKTSEGPLFNNAAQVWNHTFYWNCLSPKGGGAPTGKVAEAINRDLGSFSKFQEDFTTACLTQFGSGWAWLVKNASGKLEIAKTANAATPFTEGKTPILTCDVWEHAYYVDFRNRRPDYVKAFWGLVNWDFVNSKL